MNLTRLWARLALDPTSFMRVRKGAVAAGVLTGVVWGAGFYTLQRVNQETESLRAQVLTPQQEQSLPPEEEALYREIATIAEKVLQAPNPQSYAIGLLSQSAQQQGLSVMSVESSEVMDSAPVEGGWKPRLLRFQLQGSTAQAMGWLMQLERVPLVVKLRGVQMSSAGSQNGRLQMVVEMEVLLPDPNAQQGATTT
ncbi:MAG: hypothetical protein K6U12_09355 [Armatimonadetes bacterium]|nr:hypothetical protein [Armatimonadota bacterium]CUU37250.1 hypothetical protein DCOP10_119291 [Armatimonadetes bacterium DC]